jgi:hypothetical protein
MIDIDGYTSYIRFRFENHVISVQKLNHKKDCSSELLRKLEFNN